MSLAEISQVINHFIDQAAESATPPSPNTAADICAEMAVTADKCADEWHKENDKFGGAGPEAEKFTRYSAMADVLREAERRIRAHVATPDSAHPEDFCKKCDRPNIVWFAPNDLWNKYVRANNEPEILCPVCFVQLVEQDGGSTSAWRIAPEFYGTSSVPDAVDLEAGRHQGLEEAARIADGFHISNAYSGHWQNGAAQASTAIRDLIRARIGSVEDEQQCKVTVSAVSE